MVILLKQLETVRWQFDNVPRSDGRFLKQLIIKTKRKNALEIGSANGYSAIWIGSGIRANNGRLHTIEIRPPLAKQCRENIRLAGLEAFVNCIEGDAIKKVEELPGNFDFLFLDLGPVDMLPILHAAEAKLTDDAIIMLHNLSFEYSYKRLLKYAILKRWAIDKHQEDNGKGFFVVAKEHYLIRMLSMD